MSCNCAEEYLTLKSENHIYYIIYIGWFVWGMKEQQCVIETNISCNCAEEYFTLFSENQNYCSNHIMRFVGF
jgi:hypothetical protein